MRKVHFETTNIPHLKGLLYKHSTLETLVIHSQSIVPWNGNRQSVRGLTTSVKDAAGFGGDTKGRGVGPEELRGAAWGGLEALPEEDCLACSWALYC